MSGRTWEPGDELPARTGGYRVVLEWNEIALTWLLRAVKDGGYGPGYASLCEDIRRAMSPSPLVVIDPESGDDLDNLCKALVEAMHKAGDEASAANGVHPATMQAALRSLLTTKPEDPRALGAVVRSGDGTLWTRIAVAEAGPVWRRAGSGFSAATWADLNVSTPDQILSAGWVEDGAL